MTSFWRSPVDLPHLIAYTIVGTADELAEVTRSEVLKFSAGGFRDFTRIAASDPTMWRDVFLANKDAVLEMLGTFNREICPDSRAPSAAATATRCLPFHPHARHPPRHRADRTGVRPLPDSAGRIPNCRSSRCRAPTRNRMTTNPAGAGSSREIDQARSGKGLVPSRGAAEPSARPSPAPSALRSPHRVMLRPKTALRSRRE